MQGFHSVFLHPLLTHVIPACSASCDVTERLADGTVTSWSTGLFGLPWSSSSSFCESFSTEMQNQRGAACLWRLERYWTSPRSEPVQFWCFFARLKTPLSVKLSRYFQVCVTVSFKFNPVSEFWTPLCVLTLEYRDTLCSVVFAFSQNHKYFIDPRGKTGTLQLLLLE